MLILAGVSLNALVGDNGIITNAQNANFKNQKAILQEYFDNFYVEHYDEFGSENNKAAVLQNITVSRNWIYKGKLGYVVDEKGYVHYFLIIENMPKEVKDSIKVGIGEKTYSDYANCKDVWGITEDLKVYYCNDGLNSIDGVTLADLGKENGNDTAFSAGSEFAKLISKDNGTSITKSDLRGVQKLTIDSSVKIENLNDLYNFTNLEDLTLVDLTLTNLDGIEYLAKVSKIFITRCTIGNYSRLSEIANQIKYLLIEDIGNDEVAKLCDNIIGIGGKDFPNLAYFGIYGEVHYRLGSNSDSKEGYGSSKHSGFSQMNYLSQLSKITKERITDLYLNNNSIAIADNLFEFSGVERLRIENNYLTSLSGLYNLEQEKGMLALKYLHVSYNQLGFLESNTIDEKMDSLSIFLIKAPDVDEEGKYVYEERFKNLVILNLAANPIVHLNYLKCNEELLTFYFNCNSKLNLDSGIQSILPILEGDTITYECDTYVTNYILENSKKINYVSLSDRTMKANDFSDFMKGRGSYLRKLDLTNLVLTDDEGNQLSNETTLTYNETVESVLENLTGLFSIKCSGDAYMTSIDFVENMSVLCEIDLTGTGVTDLEPLSNLSSTYDAVSRVVIDNPNIVVANVPDSNGYAEITPVEILFNNTWATTRPDGVTSSLFFCSDNPGIILANRSLVSQLSNSTNITKFKSGYFQVGYVLGDEEEVTFDLSKTKVTSVWYRRSGCKKGDKFLFPTTITSLTWQNNERQSVGSDTYMALKLDSTNVLGLTELKTVVGSNCDWNSFWSTVSMLPAVESIEYYYAYITNSNSLENYIDGLKVMPLTTLRIYGASSDYYFDRSTCSENELKYISQISSLTKLHLMYLSGLKDASFLKNLSNLKELWLYKTAISSLSFICYEEDDDNTVFYMPNLYSLRLMWTPLSRDSYDENGERIDNLEIMKKAFTKALRSVNISSTNITSNDISESDIVSLKWSEFIY